MSCSRMPKPLWGEMWSQSTDNIGAKLADEVERVLGRRHRLRIAKVERPAEQGTPDALQDIIKKAESQEIEVHVKE